MSGGHFALPIKRGENRYYILISATRRRELGRRKTERRDMREKAVICIGGHVGSKAF
jgi:hypothetical protein